MSVNGKGKITATAGGGRAVAELATGNIAEIWGKTVETKRGATPRVVDLPVKDAYKHSAFLALHEKLANAREDSPGACAVNIYLQSIGG